MEDNRSPDSVSVALTNGCLVVHVPPVLQDKTIRLLQRDVLDAVHRTGSKGVILDLSGVRILDSFLATGIVNTAKMLSVIGAVPVLAGIRPEVAASIVYMDINLKGLRFAVDLEEAHQILTSVTASGRKAETEKVEMESEDGAEDEGAGE